MHDARAEPLALGVRNDVGDSGIHRRDERVGGAEVKADDFAHGKVFLATDETQIRNGFRNDFIRKAGIETELIAVLFPLFLLS